MIRIGILGEHFENDASALKALLDRNTYKWKTIFFPIIKNLSGGQLDNADKIKKRIQGEMVTKRLDYVICIRDLDGLASETNKIQAQNAWYQKLDLKKAGVFYLVIFEAEAMILADIETFNKKYGIKISFKGNPLSIQNPKEWLKHQTAKSSEPYHEAHALDIFKKLDFNKVKTNHTGPLSFNSFVEKLDAIIHPKSTP